MRSARHRLRRVVLLGDRALPCLAPDGELVLQIYGSSFQIREPQLVVVAKVFELCARRPHLYACVLNCRTQARGPAGRRGPRPAQPSAAPRRRVGVAARGGLWPATAMAVLEHTSGPNRKGLTVETSYVRMGIRPWPRVECLVTSVRGVVVIAHGGQEVSTARTTAVQPAVLRMIPVAAAIGRAVRGRGVVIRRPRFGVRGWNGAAGLAGPRPERAAGRHPRRVRAGSRGPGRALDGARAALRAAGHPCVAAVAGRAVASARRAGRSAGRTEHPARARDRGPRHQPGRYLGLRRPGPRPDRGRRDRGTRAASTRCSAERRCGTPSRPRSPARRSACRRPAARSAVPWPARAHRPLIPAPRPPLSPRVISGKSRFDRN